MKRRQSFVSNSSSASFVLWLDRITEEQKKAILQEYNSLEMDYWDFFIVDDRIVGFTIMDNGDFIDFLDSINVPENAYSFCYY